MAELIGTVLVLGLAVAFTSPVSVVTVIVLLSLPRGKLRALGFIGGWLLAIAVIAVLTWTVFGQDDFGSKQTTPSRTASAVELVLGVLILGFAVVKHRRRGPQLDKPSASMPKWLDRLTQTHWLVAFVVGAFMLTYSFTIIAATEILKANVSGADDAVAFALFAVASIATISAPLIYAFLRPARAEETLARWQQWLADNSGTVALVILMVFGAALIAKATYDLVS